MKKAFVNPTTHVASSNLSLRYSRSDTAVAAVNLLIPRGAITAIIGPNGCGKSTLLRGLAGLMHPTTGSVVIDGQTIASLSTREVARRIGLLPQEQERPEAVTVADLALRGRYPHLKLLQPPGSFDHAAVERALALTEMTELRDRAMDQLSGGQRQRGWIAMALAQDTPAMLLDEPTTYLDLAHRRKVLALLRRLRDEEGKTIVVVLHELNDALRLADQVIVMEDGKVRIAGTPAELTSGNALDEAFGLGFSRFTVPGRRSAGRPYLVPTQKFTGLEQSDNAVESGRINESAGAEPMDELFEPEHAKEAPEPFAAAHDVSFRYDDQVLFSGVSVEIPRRAVTGIIGPNGSGKSTLLRLLTGVLEPDAGAINILNKPIGKIGARERAHLVSMLSQQAAPPGEMMVQELVAVGRHPHQRWYRQWSRTDRAACDAAMDSCAVRGLADRRTDSVSGGQLQRARIASALAQEADLLALDEPTSFLDVHHQEEILALVRGINQASGRTVVMVLHDIIHAARYTDYLIVLDRGRLAASGPPCRVLTPELVQSVFGVAAAPAVSYSGSERLLLPLI